MNLYDQHMRMVKEFARQFASANESLDDHVTAATLQDLISTALNGSSVNITSNETAYELAEEEHTYDAVTTLFLNVTLIGCLLMAYTVRKFRMYYLPESACALLLGVVVGGIARLSTDRLQLFEFSPEVFFFVLLPPIIFEAGYSVNRKDFFDNIGAISLYAILGTMISTFTVGGLTFLAARSGLIRDIDQENPMEALLFGALISAVDPVATLSIMGNAELRCDPLLYSLVFGESVLNDAVAISLFKVFAKYYNPDGPAWSESEIALALWSFFIVTVLSIGVGVGLGLTASFLYKHTDLRQYPHLETSLLFSFCYLCYATGESVGLSGIMALFFQGVVLSHYNSYNLSETAHVASEQIFSTLATIAETAVFLYMGMGVFTGRFENYDFLFSILALAFCLLGRAGNIFPLSWIANLCRRRGSDSSMRSATRGEGGTGNTRISIPMQCVLWFAGLRGAIAFALAMNMPGPNREVYATATLSICIFTTVVCGGLTDRMLTLFEMKQTDDDVTGVGLDDEEEWTLRRVTFTPPNRNNVAQQIRYANKYPLARRTGLHVYRGTKRLWQQFDDEVLKTYFGGLTDNDPNSVTNDHADRGLYEMGKLNDDRSDENGNGRPKNFESDGDDGEDHENEDFIR